MGYRFFKNTFLFLLVGVISCGRSTGQSEPATAPVVEMEQNAATALSEEPILPGANQLEDFLPLLKGKNVGLVGNQSSVVFHGNEKNSYTHLVDTLLTLNVDLKKVFAPEHGFRGTADAGEVIKDGKDSQTGLEVVSLYGNNKKPSPQQLEGIDILLFDLQDVGARFYTYISSLHYVMEACAENNIPLIVLDRPNPNGHYVDGPILDPEHSSFVGMHPIPIVHGLTMGEYAQMINGENWLKNAAKADLTVVEVKNYSHDKFYSLAIKPSPNLPNDQAINLYPSLCFFEGTNVNAGRGTDKQFQVFGSPFLDREIFTYSYTPESKPGAKNPKHLGVVCYGKDLTEFPRLEKINLSWLLEAYHHTADKSQFFNNFFTNLAGGTELRRQIEQGLSEEEIRKSWQPELEDYKQKRQKYLLY